MAVRLSKRLTALASLVDIHEGPLRRAEEHVQAYGLSSKITLRLSDGVQQLREGETDTILIAGMGGGLMQKILSEGMQVVSSARELILQPQSEVSQLRCFLRENGFQIQDEDMVEEDGKYYPMMKVHKLFTNEIFESDAHMLLLQDLFGPVLLEKKHPVLRAWIARELKTAEMILAQLCVHDGNPQIAVRMQEIRRRQELLLEAEQLLGRACGTCQRK